MFKVDELPIKDLKILEGRLSEDQRGIFVKNYERGDYKNKGLEFRCSESFFSSSKRGVIRGLHFQFDHPQIKLVTVVQGSVYDVCVDLRRGSTTFGKWAAVELSGNNHKSLYIPAGFAHGFQALEDDSIMLYMCDGAYSQETDSGIVYNDKEIEISWPLDDNVIVSERDKELMSFSEFKSKFGGL